MKKGKGVSASLFFYITFLNQAMDVNEQHF